MSEMNGHGKLSEEQELFARLVEVRTAERDEARLIVRHLLQVTPVSRTYMDHEAQLAWRLAKKRAGEWT